MKTSNRITYTLIFITILVFSFHTANAQDKLSGSFDVELNGYAGDKLKASYNNRILRRMQTD